MSTVLDDDATLEMVAGLDWSTLQLSAEQGFVLTRVVGKVSVKDLVALSGLPPIAAKSAIVALVRAGALRIEGEGGRAIGREDPAGAKPERAESDKAYKGFVFSPANLAEQTDLSEEQMKRILFVHAHLGDWNHYALLGLKRTAKSSEIKRGYFKASKEFHPDAYFRKELGTYKGKVGAIFKAMKGAYDVLSDAKMREEYDGTLGADFSPEELAELEARAVERRAVVEAERAEEAKRAAAERRMARVAERKKNKRIARNPMIGNIKRGRELAELAKTAMSKKEFKAAARHARMALEFSKNHPSIEAEVKPILVEADQTRATALIRSVSNSLSADEEKMRSVAEEVEGLAHGKAKLLIDAAELYVLLKDLRHAIKLAQKAVNSEPESERALRTLSDYAEQGGQMHTALKAAEKLLSLDPKSGENKERVKRIKRSL